ncbi:hypothetical protein [Confluentibacter flavum]|uniref:Uncharacterized protein n=1 Tax=Confluentibacter flavum TaxID=1909700 RepID=A0A2N3HJJ0_9FLAO|nr:hypothetical protein [Confluentibacter flavum]PKQ45054.1 hypothetical protein CSW08_10090 [Confluentibacter flavum]
MAEIKIEKKSPIWPWILLVIAVIAIVAYFVYNSDNDDDTIYDNDMNDERMDTNSNTYEDGYQSTAPYTSSTSAIQEFENSVTDSTRIGTDSTYTKTAIINLAKVVSMKADELNLQPSIALENLRYYSNRRDGMTNSELPESSDVINFKTVSNDIVAVLEILQTNSYPSLQDEIAELKQTSNKIDNSIATKEQQSTIQTFFTKARKVVNNMNT